MVERKKIIVLVREMQNGKEEAFTKLYDAYFQDIYYYILRIVNDSELASDLTQETFIEIYQNVAGLKEPEAFVKWTKTIAYHKCTAHFRKKRDVLLEENEEDVSMFDTIVEEREEFIPDEALDQDELKKAIQEMIDSLPENQRAAIMMRYFDEMSVQDIADIQNVSEGTVKSRLNYGRKAIKAAVEEYEKKTGVKLHCAGVLPLLLWAFQGYWKVNGTASAGGAAAITASIKGGAATASKSMAKAVTRTAVKEGVKTGVKGIVTKVAIGVLVLATVSVGVFVGTKKKSDIEDVDTVEKNEKVISSTAYGTVFGDTLVISAEPIEKYENEPADVESDFFPFGEDEDDIKEEITKAVILDELYVGDDAWFKGYSSLESIEGLDKLHTEQSQYLVHMFYGCSSLTSIQGLEKWDVSNVIGMWSMFRDCSSLTDIDSLKDWDVSNVTGLDSEFDMFNGCSSLTNIDALKDWDLSNAKSMGGMFSGCSSLTDIDALNDWDMSNVIHMWGMFSDCSSLTNIDALQDWDVSNVTDMGNMFNGCASLTTLTALEKWDVSNVVNMKGIFAECSSLTTFAGLEKWDVSSVTDMSFAFSDCSSITTTEALYGWNVNDELYQLKIFLRTGGGRPTWYRK